MKILLLNPPSNRVVLREYYCSKLSKGGYASEPIDLAVQSAILGKEHDISVLDCVIDRINERQTIEYIRKNNFEVILFLSGSVSYLADFALMEKIKNLFGVIFIVGSGDIFMGEPEKILEDNKFIDAVLLDFTSDGLEKLLKGQRPEGIVCRDKDRSIVKYPQDNNKGYFTIPVPRHELFPLNKYTYPVIIRRPFATIITEFGCPFKCGFCIMNTIPKKIRPLDNVREELIYLKKLKVKELFIIDQTFGVDKKRLYEFCLSMKDFKFSWFCFSRVDIMDYEKLKMMKEAGCHTIMFGAESGRQDILDKSLKNISLKKIPEVCDLCKTLKIRTLMTFILGLPGDDYSSCIQTIEFAKSLSCDYVSFNIAIPRMATKMRKEAVEKGIISSDVLAMDQTGSDSIALNENLSIEQLNSLQRKGYLEFYLRPRYLLNKILAMSSLTEIFVHIRDGYYLLYQMLSRFGRTKFIANQ